MWPKTPPQVTPTSDLNLSNQSIMRNHKNIVAGSLQVTKQYKFLFSCKTYTKKIILEKHTLSKRCTRILFKCLNIKQKKKKVVSESVCIQLAIISLNEYTVT